LTFPESHSAWDAGDLGCGELVLELRMRMRKLERGQIMHLTARDLGAPADIPAWCRMTGDLLVHTDPASHSFFIQRT
jgi:tRNA 2-thiouridine synthesizing protein A